MRAIWMTLITLRWPYRWALGSTLALGAIAITLSVWAPFTLTRVTLDGRPLSLRESSDLGLRVGRSALTQELGLAAQLIGHRAGVGAVSVKMNLPNTIDIVTNEFAPRLMVYDLSRRRVMALDEQARLIEYPHDLEIGGPLLIGLGGLRMFECPADNRINLVAGQLHSLREMAPAAYEAISEIDFSNSAHLTVSFTRFPFLARVTATQFGEALEEIFLVASGADAPLTDATIIDATCPNLLALTPNTADPATRAHDDGKGPL